MGVAKVPNHGHCVICNKAVPYGDETCSAECDQELEEQEKKRKRMKYITYGFIAFGVLLIAVQLVFAG